MFDEKRKLELMREAIAEAKLSKAEDTRPRPFVGAILCDEDGHILLRAHRGEIHQGGHAEYTIFQKAEEKGIDTHGKTLFVTLEPCTRRNVGKIPCAVRVATNGIKRLFIGTLDPNPNISGRSETYLINKGIEVERFPFSLTSELMKLNAQFFDEHAPYSAPLVALAELKESGAAKTVRGNRESLLQTSLDLITYSQGQISIFSGGTSWARELQVGLVFAALEGREARVLCEINEVSRFEKDHCQCDSVLRLVRALK